MSRRTEAVVIILFGVGFGLVAIFLSRLGLLAYILLAVSLCLILYGTYLYANSTLTKFVKIQTEASRGRHAAGLVAGQ
jgi:hypothetical protein